MSEYAPVDRLPLFAPEEKPPFVKGSDTSRAAAKAVAQKSASVRANVLEFIRSRGYQGATDSEIEQALGLLHQTASARRGELVKAKKVFDSGERRMTANHRKATVWTVVK